MRALNPATGTLIRDYPTHTLAETKSIIEKSQKAWLSWRDTDIESRKHLLLETAMVLRSGKEEYARLMSLEMGKIIGESRAEIEKCALVCEYYAKNGESFLADEIVQTESTKSFISFEPIGIALAVMPWNFPFWQVFRFAAPALMAGNAGLLKHASNVPGCALAIEDIFLKAGFPEHLFRTLMIPGSDVESIIKNNHVRAVTLTGSEAAGSEVASIAGRELKKSVLELGGSDPFIVLDDADIDLCAKIAAQARMINTGQSCIAAKRFIVVESRLKAFEEKQSQFMSDMVMGDPLDENTDIGPMARTDLREELHEQVQSSLAKGARLLLGGSIVEGPGAFYGATVVTNVKPGMSLYHEETFGPVSAIIPVKNAEEAIRVANDSDFGLGASLWTQDLEQGEKLARRIESGAVFVNGMTVSDPRMPFGGIKRSGYGRELSHFGIREFVNIKSIVIA